MFVPGRATSTTGGRSRLIPTPFSDRPVARPSLRATASLPVRPTAAGELRGGPGSRLTCPPSWSIMTSSGRPPGARPAAACRSATSERTLLRERTLRANRITPPSSPAAARRSSASGARVPSKPTTIRWPACWASERPATGSGAAWIRMPIRSVHAAVRSASSAAAAAEALQSPTATRATPHRNFALDIEATEVGSIPLRNRLQGRLAATLRRSVGPDYALGAIVPEAGALFWPGFPYAQTARYFDVFLPMAYFTFRVGGAGAVRSYVARNISTIKAVVGPDTPVHPIGGLADKATPSEVRAYVRAARAGGAIGGSLYDFNGTTSEAWRLVRGVP